MGTTVRAFRVIILADTAFGSVEFLKAMRKHRYPVIVGVRSDRKLSDGRQVCDLVKKGQQVTLEGLSFPVTLSWLYRKRDGKLEKRFVLSTRPLKGSTITWWGRRRGALRAVSRPSNTALAYTALVSKRSLGFIGGLFCA